MISQILRHIGMNIFPRPTSLSISKKDLYGLNRLKVLGSEDRDEYQQILDRACDDKDSRMIANRYPWQSRLAIRKLFGYAANKKLPICMLTGTGGEHHFVPPVIKSLEMALKGGCKTRILVWQPDSSKTSQKLLDLESEYENLEIRFSGTSDLGEELTHFQVSGDDAYRQEAAHREIMDPHSVNEYEPSFAARINFNDKAGAARLLKFFDVLWL